jgi:hypothetical protein
MTTATDDSVDVARGTAKVEAILRTNGALGTDEQADNARKAAEASPKPRRTRSDAGKPREKKPVSAEGKLSQAQVSRLEGLNAMLHVAERDYRKALDAYRAFLEEITVK